MSAPTPTELRATLVTLVAGATETRTQKWERLIGDVEMLPIAFHPRCNWQVEVEGSEEDRRVIDAAIALLKGKHPYVSRKANPGAWAPGASRLIAHRPA